MSPLNKRKSLFSKETVINMRKRKIQTMYNADILGAFIRENPTKDSLLLKSPVVILERLPNILPRTPQKISHMIVDNSMKILKSSSKRNSLNNRNSGKRDITLPSTVTLKFSTPKTKQQSRKGSRTSNRNNVSHPSENSFNINNCNVLDFREQTASPVDIEEGEAKKKNETYELAEPETPNLQRVLQERQSKKDERTNSNGKRKKKAFRVHFKRLSSDINRTHIPILKNLPYKKRLAEESCDQMVVITKNKNIKQTMLSIPQRKLNSMEIKSVTPIAGVHGKSRINTTPLNSTVKEPDLKNSVRKKLPNFSEIHKKLFAKSESVVDARKRLEERHTALTTSAPKNVPITHAIPKNSSLPYYSNKYQLRCKVRIKDAKNCIVKKQPTANPIMSKCHQENREFLKGVRTNRRFELQMKSRNIKL